MPFDVTVAILDARAAMMRRNDPVDGHGGEQRPFVRKDGKVDPPGIGSLKRMFGGQG